MTTTQGHPTEDTLLLLDGGTVAKTAAATGDGGVLDLGTGQVKGEMIADVSARDVASGDELYEIVLQGCAAQAFSSGIHELAVIRVGVAAAKSGGADITDPIGRHAVPFRNDALDANGNRVVLQYVRARFIPVGTSPSITARTQLTKSELNF